VISQGYKMTETITSFLSLEKTITNNAAPFTTTAIPVYEVNIHVYDNDIYYGDGATQSAIAQAGSVLYFPKIDLRDLFFKNRTAYLNARVVIVASTPDKTVEVALRGY